MRSFRTRNPARLLHAVLACLLALGLAGCAGLLNRDPVRINVVGLEPLPGQGLEMRFAVRLRVQNPNDAPIDYDGVALELEVNGKPFATGVSSQSGSVPRFGETVFSVPVSVSAFSAARQALGVASGATLTGLPYVIRGRLAGGAFGGVRFVDRGSLDFPGLGDL